MQSRHESQIFMIRVAQCQHGGSFLGIAWDPGTSWFDSLAARYRWESQFLLSGVHFYREHWTGFLGGRFYVGWTEPLQYLIDLFDRWPSEGLLC
jgi:hypothetical protein